MKLGNICKFQSGGTPSKGETSYFNGNIPWITTVALNGSIIDESNAVDWITEKAIEKSAAKIVPANSVMVGTRVGVGKVAINKVPMSTSQDIISLLDIDESKWNKEFICKFILGKGNYLNSQARGATIKGIKIETLAGLQLPDIPLEQQCKIAAAIDAVNNLIALRKEQLAKLDQLVKSRFIELFGEIKETTKLVECCSRITDYVASGSFASIKENVKYYDVEEYAVMVKTADFANGFTKNLTYTDKHGYEFLHNSNLFGGELLLSNIGASIGKVHRVPQLNKPMTLAPNAIMIKGNELYLDDYLQYFFISHLGQRQLKEMTTATAMPKFNKTQLKEVVVPVAPMELQKQFSAFVEKTDKSKLAIQQSLDKLETLKKSLMQEYFG